MRIQGNEWIYLVRLENRQLAILKSSEECTGDKGRQHPWKGLIVAWNCCHGTDLPNTYWNDDSGMVKGQMVALNHRIKVIIITKIGDKAIM